MRKRLLIFALACLVVTPLQATVTAYKLHNHPNNQITPPPYGLRLDGLLGAGNYTFSFDYSDSTGMASMTLEYDDVANEIHIFGRAYGGRDTGTGWDPAEQGWIDVDFTYTTNVTVADNEDGDPGDDLWVTGESGANNGTITLDGWGGNQVFSISDKEDEGRSFQFDNDEDHKGNNTFANNPMIWSGTGWLMGAGSGTRDWTFWGEKMMSVPVEQKTWSDVKDLYTN